jgi:hypothetical protein
MHVHGHGPQPQGPQPLVQFPCLNQAFTTIERVLRPIAFTKQVDRAIVPLGHITAVPQEQCPGRSQKDTFGGVLEWWLA